LKPIQITQSRGSTRRGFEYHIQVMNTVAELAGAETVVQVCHPDVAGIVTDAMVVPEALSR